MSDTVSETVIEREPDLFAEAKAFCAAARAGVKMEEDGRAAFRDNTMSLARTLLVIRERCQKNNKTFSAQLKDNGFDALVNKDERGALILMAEHPEIAQRLLATTQSRSWQLVGNEIRRVLSAQNTPSKAGRKAASNRGGRPRKAPVQSDDPIADLAREIVAKCSDQRLTLPKLASMAGGVADSAVREALCHLKQAGKRAGLDDVVVTNSGENGREYWIDGEPARETLKAAKAPAPSPDEPALPSRTGEDRDLLAVADVEIADLKRQLAEKDAEIARLHARIQELEETYGVKPQGVMWQ
jgi:hypothetical protein